MVSFSVRGVANGRQKSMKGQSQPCWLGLHDLQDICRRNFDFLATGTSFTSEKILRTKRKLWRGIGQKALGRRMVTWFSECGNPEM